MNAKHQVGIIVESVQLRDYSDTALRTGGASIVAEISRPLTATEAARAVEAVTKVLEDIGVLVLDEQKALEPGAEA